MYNQAAGNHPETCGSKKVFCLYANINIQFSVQCIIIYIVQVFFYIESALRRMCTVLVRTIFCISYDFGSLGSDFRWF